MLTENDYNAIAAELAKHPCEVCGAPSTSWVHDFDNVITPRNATCGPVEMRWDGTGAHFYCDSHSRNSQFRDVYEGWPFPIK